MKVLVNAYACSPDMGSEPGMAWNWCVNLAQHCELFIITEGEFRDRIESVLPTLPQGGNMHFYYNPVPDKVRNMCWNQGDWRFYWYYRQWQKKTLDIARDICHKEKIDILHQLNMIGFREPGYLWKITQETRIPFVWGPVDAKEEFPMSYAKGAGLKVKMFLLLKNLITRCQLRYSHRVREAVSSASLVFAASSNSVSTIKKFFSIDAILINETGTYPMHCSIGKGKKVTKNTFNILWVGKMDFRKQLNLAMESIGMETKPDIRLHIVGGGDGQSYRQLEKRFGETSFCIWHGMVSHDEVQQVMRDSDMLLFTSVAEGTPHVVLEAIANGLPVLCFDTCGQGDCVNEKVGIKIPLTNPRQSVRDFAEKIEYLYHHREVLQTMSENCKKRAEELSWENKARKMVSLYEQVLKKHNVTTV